MQVAQMHPEDIKAGIRKRFGTITQFEREKGLPEKSVNDLLRGRSSARVLDAVKAALSTEVPQSEVSDNSDEADASHRLISTVR